MIDEEKMRKLIVTERYGRCCYNLLELLKNLCRYIKVQSKDVNE